MAGRQATSHNEITATRVGTPEIWREIADLADEYGVSFEKLLRRYEEYRQDVREIRKRLQRTRDAKSPEKTKPAPESVLLPPNSDWLTSDQAETIVPGIMWAVRRTGIATDRIMRSTNATHPARCGWLWKRGDLERLKRIQDSCRVRVAEALRIMDAIERIRPDGVDSDEWLTTVEAREIIPSILHAAAHCPVAIRRKLIGRVPQRNGWLWHKGDILHVLRVMDACRIPSRVALRVVTAQKRGDL